MDDTRFKELVKSVKDYGAERRTALDLAKMIKEIRDEEQKHTKALYKLKKQAEALQHELHDLINSRIRGDS